MSDPVFVKFQLTRELWRQFYQAHYSADHSLKVRYLWGATCIIIGSFGLGGLLESKLVAVLLLVTGFYGVLSKQIFVVKSVKSACKHPFYNKELMVAISAGEIAVRSEGSGYSQPWDNFIGYRKLKPGFAFYHDRRSFFFLPGTAMTEEKEARLMQILESVAVPKL